MSKSDLSAASTVPAASDTVSIALMSATMNEQEGLRVKLPSVAICAFTKIHKEVL